MSTSLEKGLNYVEDFMLQTREALRYKTIVHES